MSDDDGLLARLDEEVHAALRAAYAPRSKGPLATAARAFAAWAARVPGRELFVMPTVRGEIAAEAHNEWTLCLWAWHEGQRISEVTGRKLKAGTIESRVSLLKGLLSHRYGFQIAGEAPRLRSLLKLRRESDPQHGVRRKRRGLRRRHLRKLWRSNARVRANTFTALNEWAATTTAWHVLARGGELKGVRRSDLQFGVVHAFGPNKPHAACTRMARRPTRRRGAWQDSRGRRYACIWLAPLKKRGASTAKVPQYILEQPGEDWEPYAALRRLADAPIWPDGDTWLFRASPSTPITTVRAAPAPTHSAATANRRPAPRACPQGKFRALMKRNATALGYNPKEFGAHSPRIGGATDIESTGAASQLLLQAKGRWQSDIGRIYARMTRRAHLAASALMHRAKGRDLEELLPTFTELA